MELCKKVQVEEFYVIHVKDSTQFYTSLRFFLLASPWFPRPLGLALWRVLHMFLVLSMTPLLLATYSIVFAFAVYVDAVMLSLFVAMVLVVILCMIFRTVCKSFLAVIVWIWLLISCNVPRREPGQALTHYILTAGRTLPQTPPAGEEQVPTNAGDGCFLCDLNGNYAPTAQLVNHLKVEAIPEWRVTLGNWCREIVPTDDAVVVI